MAFTQVVVRVLDGPSVVDESIRRPVRLTPDGFAGVVYAGAVYPLLPDNLVDIAGSSWEIEDCNRFLFSGAAIPYAPRVGVMTPEPGFDGFSGKWSVETNRFGHYVVFNASERIAGHVVDALEAAGLSVQRWDVSHRPASDGMFYDWFARLRFKGSRDECVARVSTAFSATRTVSPVEEAPQPTVERLEQLEAQAERLLDQVMELRERLVASEEDSAQLRVKLHNATTRETQLTGALDRALAHQKALHEQFDALRDSAQHTSEINALLAQQAETEELMELALAENADLQHQIATMLQGRPREMRRSGPWKRRSSNCRSGWKRSVSKRGNVTDPWQQGSLRAWASLDSSIRHSRGLRLCLTVSRSWPTLRLRHRHSEHSCRSTWANC